MRASYWKSASGPLVGSCPELMVQWIRGTVEMPCDHRRPRCGVLIGVILPFTPLAATRGLVPLPGGYFVCLGRVTVTVTYRVVGELGQRRLMRTLLGMGPGRAAAKAGTAAS